MQARNPRRPQNALRRPMAGRRPVPVTEPCRWQNGWWATLTVDQFDAAVARCREGDLFTWAAQPGVTVGDVYLLVTTAPERRLRAWGWVVGAPVGDEVQGWRVTVRFGGLLGDPVCLRALRQDPALAVWTPLARVMAGRLEGVPPAVWQVLRGHVGLQVAEALAAAADVREAAAAAPDPLPAPAGHVRAPEPPTEGGVPHAWPWDGLGRGRFFEELVQRVLLPQGFTLVALQPQRDEAGIDVVAHRPQIRWTRWVAQLDVTGEPVEAAAVHEVRQGCLVHGAQTGLIIATGPLSAAVRALALEQQVELWDAAWLRSAWLRATDGHGLPASVSESGIPLVRQQAIAI